MQTRTRSAVRLRPRTAPRTTAAHDFAIFTAMDGTLLDAATFRAGAAADVVRELVGVGVPVVPVSVMTLDELAPVANELGLRRTMIIEAGGAIARWSGAGWDVEPCGPPAETLLDVVRAIEDLSGANLLVYSAMGERDAAAVSGRSGEMLRGSVRRCFSEPFVLESGSLDKVKRAAHSLGFSIRKGRRFLHIGRECDEGEAFMRVREELGCALTVALGSAAVDGSFLRRADMPVVIPGPDGTPDRELLRSVPTARVAPAPGPDGWAAAVREIEHNVRRSASRIKRA